MLPRLHTTPTEASALPGAESKPTLTSHLQAPTESLPGDHGDRFTEELERASGRSAVDEAGGRRSSRRSESDQRASRDERGRATEAREARRESADRTERPSEAGDPGANARPDGPTDRQSFQIEARRRTELSGKPEGARIQSTTPDDGPDDGSADEAAPGAAGFAGMAGIAQGTAASQGASSTQASSTVQATGRVAATRPGPAVAAPAAPAAPNAKAPATGAPTNAPSSPADALGELLTQREEALERDASVLRQLRASLAPGRREISLNLNPAELGRMQLRLAVRGGRLTAHLKAESPEALAAIERQLPELSASLEAQGFEVQSFDLELADTGLSGQGFADPRQGETPAPAVPGLLAGALGDAATTPTKTTPTSAADGGLDLLV